MLAPAGFCQSQSLRFGALLRQLFGLPLGGGALQRQCPHRGLGFQAVSRLFGGSGLELGLPSGHGESFGLIIGALFCLGKPPFFCRQLFHRLRFAFASGTDVSQIAHGIAH